MSSSYYNAHAPGVGKKTSWPEVVGMSAEEAKKVILKDKPDANIIVLPVYSPVQQDLRFDRVHIFVATVAGVLTVPDAPRVE
jgi:hypothetical protein